MYEMFIAVCGSKSYGGEWGVGKTIAHAITNLREAGGYLRHHIIYRFTSELPFAPRDRDCTDQEADCWVGRDGNMSWIRCEREIVA